MERALEIPVNTENTSPGKRFYGPMDGAKPAVEQAVIGRSLVIKGDINGVEALYIDGRVEGRISVPENRVTIGRMGSVLSDIEAREIVVMGTVKGNLTCSDRADVRNGSSVTGEVIAKRVTIEDGAMIKGSIEVRTPREAKQAAPPKIETEAAPSKDPSNGGGRPCITSSDQSASQVEGSSVLLTVK
jgi:cytoskeletal protein CcmA (bactofilin family)